MNFIAKLIFNTILSFYCIANIANGLVGGRNPKLNEVKYQVAVLSQGKVCGGGIIDDKYIITAAHCVHNKTFDTLYPTRVVASTNVTSNYDLNASIVKYVRRAFVHSSYIPNIRAAFDIAVLELTGSIQIGKNSDRLQELLLPEPVSSGPEIFTDYDNLNVIVAGYGLSKVNEEKDKKGKTIYNTEGVGDLHVANATVYSWEACRKHFKATLNYRMCIKVNAPGEKYRGVCKGDSGGPVVLNGNIVLGVASSLKSCVNSPAIFIRTSSFLQFIKDAMNGTITKDMTVYTHA